MRGAVRSYIGIGSNIEPRRRFIDDALRLLGDQRGVVVRRVASIRETSPVGPIPDQNAFLNSVAEVDVRLKPLALLHLLHGIERRLGRDRAREVAQGPRTIDLDLLLYADRSIAERGLVVPHPRLADRPFVLQPLAELCPLRRHPQMELTFAELLRRSALPGGHA